MTETVLVLPVLLLILSLIALFGFGMERLQRNTMAARHHAWDTARRTPEVDNRTNGERADDLHAAFFTDDPGDLSRGHSGRDTDASNPLRELLADADDPTAEYAEQMLDDLPGIQRTRVTTDHDTEVPLWERFTGPITADQHLLPSAWRAADGTLHTANTWDSFYRSPRRRPANALADTLLADFDELIQDYANRDNDFARSVQRWYSATPSYRGPRVTRY